jgi:hypothetical protein
MSASTLLFIINQLFGIFQERKKRVKMNLKKLLWSFDKSFLFSHFNQ